jgi:hypothetical protein
LSLLQDKSITTIQNNVVIFFSNPVPAYDGNDNDDDKLGEAMSVLFVMPIII